MDSVEARQKYELASTLYLGDKNDEALPLLDELAEAFPANKDILYARGLCLAALERYDEARAIAEQLDIVFGDPRGATLKSRVPEKASAEDAAVGESKGGRWRLALGMIVAGACIVAGLGTAVNYIMSEEEGPAVPETVRMSNLRVLTLGGNPIEDDDLANLSGLSALQRLELDNTRITDKGLVHLRNLSSLQQLQLTGTEVTTAGVQTLREALPGAQINR